MFTYIQSDKLPESREELCITKLTVGKKEVAVLVETDFQSMFFSFDRSAEKCYSVEIVDLAIEAHGVLATDAYDAAQISTARKEVEERLGKEIAELKARLAAYEPATDSTGAEANAGGTTEVRNSS